MLAWSKQTDRHAETQRLVLPYLSLHIIPGALQSVLLIVLVFLDELVHDAANLLL